MNKKHLVLILSVFLVNTCTFSAHNLYVSPAGNDTWSGRLMKPDNLGTDGPFATLERAQQEIRRLQTDGAVQQPVTVYLRGGHYFLTKPLIFKPKDSGTQECPVTYTAYKNEKPVISGGRLIVGWEKSNSNLWQNELDAVKSGTWHFRQLFIDCERRFRAKSPNTGYYIIEENPGLDPEANYQSPAKLFRYAPGDINADWTNPCDIEVVVLHFWMDTHLPVDYIDAESRIITFQKQSRRKLTDDFNNIGAKYYVDNVYEAMDLPGEWYLNRRNGILSYLARPNENMNKAFVIAPHLSQLIRFEGELLQKKYVEYITFKNIHFEHTGWELPEKDAGDLQAANTVPGAIYLKGTRNVDINQCIVRHMSTYGIQIDDGCQDIQITFNEISDLGAGGIRLSGGDAQSDSLLRTKKITITDNHLHHLGRIYHSGVGIFLQNASDNIIAHNHIHHLYYTGISAGWVWGYKPSVSVNNRIEYNHIHDIGQGVLSDIGGVYLLGVSPGTVVRNNLVHDIDSWGYGGWGLYTDEGSTDILLENNIIYNTKSAGFHQHYGKENIIRNNIFAFAREQQIQRTRNEKHKSFTFEHNIVYWQNTALLGKNWKGENYKFDHNLYCRLDGQPVTFAGVLPNEWKTKGQDTHSIITDPLFVDPLNYNFNLYPGSPAIQIGFQPIDMTNVGPREWPEKVREIKYISQADTNFKLQPALFYNPGGDEPRPLLVGLHTWSGDHTHTGSVPFAKWCMQKGWVFIHPNFRGPNNNPDATGSDLVVKDIESAVRFAMGATNVDSNRIYLVGTSGGGYTALLMAGKRSDIWAGVSAWVPISDLSAWYHESVNRKNNYADMIKVSCGGVPGESDSGDKQYFDRSPINFLANSKGIPVDINAGIHDGHTGSVPVSHSLRAFNCLTTPRQRIKAEDIDFIVKNQMIPENLKRKIQDPLYGEKNVLFRRTNGRSRVTIFEGGHEIIINAALHWLEQQRKQGK